METRRDREKEPTKKTEEDRWTELYPEIKKCVIVIARLRLDRANVTLKQVKDGERRSGEPSPDWMEPVELDDTDCEGGVRSFVKKVKVRVRGNYSRKPGGRRRGAGLLRLGPIRRNHKHISVNISQSEANYNYSLNSKEPDTPDTPNSQSQEASPPSCCGNKDGGSCSCSTEKENPLSTVFNKEVKKRRRRRRGRRKVRRQPEDDSWTPPLEKQKTKQPERKRRRRACGSCAACLREDCGKCLYCRDMRKFGGPQKQKQRCQLRVCVHRRLLVRTGAAALPPSPPQDSWIRPRPPQASLTVTTATEPQHHQRRRRGSGEDEQEVKAAKTRMRAGPRRRGGGATPRWMKEEPVSGECSEVVTESGTYYEVEVELPGSDSDQETPTASSTPSEVTEVPDDVTVSHPAHKPPDSLGLFSLLGGGAMDEVTCGRSLLHLLRALRRTELPDHWVPVLAAGPLLQLLHCSKLSSMCDTIVHVQPDHCFYITVQSRLLPHTHTVYTTHTPGITHLSQLVSLLLELEQLTVCGGLRVRSPTCQVLVAPPCLTCLPCLLQEELTSDL